MRNTITRWLMAICLSSLFSYIWPSLPPLSTIFLTTLALTGIAALIFWRPSLVSHSAIVKVWVTIAHGLAVGSLWMASVGHWYYAWQLPQDKIQQDILITGTVVKANCNSNWHSYTLDTDIFSKYWPGHRKIRVHEQSTHACMQPHDQITATVRLKPAYGVANPIGFNYQQYLVSQGIVATGSLRKRHQQTTSQNGLKKALQRIISTHAQEQQHWLFLLLLGNKSGMTDANWDLLRRTGTGHLFSISGLHLGIITAALLPVIGLVVTTSVYRGMGRGSRAILVMTFGVLAASSFTYAQLTGAGLPVIRAWLLVVTAMLITLGNRHWTGLHNGVIMLTGCILLFPLSLLSPGFYLSVGAVCIIWYLCWRWQWHRLRWYQCLWRLQIALSAALLPLMLGWFSMVSLSAIPVNLILVPLMLLLLPLLLILLALSYALPVIAGPAMALASDLMDAVIVLLVWFDEMLPSPLVYFPPAGVILALSIALFTASLPDFRYRRISIGLLLLPVLFSSVAPTSDRWSVHVLDAGQGTAVLITRGRRGVVVDTGASYADVAATAERALIPLIRHHNVQVDHVFISHLDNDHAGGSQALKRYLEEQGVDANWWYPHQGCKKGEQITWQGLEVAMLWPPADTPLTGNNASCVLAIEGLEHRLLLPGDIERVAEYALLADNKVGQADILLAPHHGSVSSSTHVFIERVAPKLVIFTQGFANRWDFPNASVVTRYRESGAAMLATSASGYIRLTLREGEPMEVHTLRGDISPRWYLRPRPVHTMRTD